METTNNMITWRSPQRSTPRKNCWTLFWLILLKWDYAHLSVKAIGYQVQFKDVLYTIAKPLLSAFYLRHIVPFVKHIDLKAILCFHWQHYEHTSAPKLSTTTELQI